MAVLLPIIYLNVDWDASSSLPHAYLQILFAFANSLSLSLSQSYQLQTSHTLLFVQQLFQSVSNSYFNWLYDRKW